MYEIKLFDKTTIQVTKQQADTVIAESTSGKSGIVVNDQYIAFKGVMSITEIPNTDYNLQTRQALPKATDPIKTKNRDKWLEVFKRNKELTAKNQPPKWLVENGKIIERESYWRETA